MNVTPHLGWPASPPTTAPGLGWPSTGSFAPVESQVTAPAPAPERPPTIEPHLDAGPEPGLELSAPVAAVPPLDLAAGPSGTVAVDAPADNRATIEHAPPADPVELSVDVDVSRETAGAPSAVARAADLAAAEISLGGDGSTPLAQAAEHSLAVASRRPPGRRLPRPGHARVMVVANQKGGVGKTTTTVNVAAALAQHGLKVLVIDLDPQGNASTALSIEHSEGTPGSYHVLVGGTPMDEVIVECPDVPGLFVVPATIDLAGAEIELVSMVARESRLKRALDSHLAECAEVGAEYDYVLIDCPPSLGLLTVNALSAGQEMLIPIQCEYYALEGLSQLLHTIEQIREHLNQQLRVGAIMLTMYDSRTRLAAGVAEEVRQHFGPVVLKTAIPRSVRISEAPSYGQTVLTYDPGSAGALSYLEAAGELAHQIEHVGSITA